MKYKTIVKFRKAHRFLGLFIGIQFLLWTISGLYFSWTDLDEIHGDYYLKTPKVEGFHFNPLSDTLHQQLQFPIKKINLKQLDGIPFLWLNDSILVNANTAEVITEISKEQAISVVKNHVLPEYPPQKAERITAVGPHDEYRGRPLPAFKITLGGEGNPVAYVDARNGDFQRIRHRQWRWFDFLWMTHTMDYQGRDNFNSWVLRGFSLLGLITVVSGFALAFITSPFWQRQKN